MWTLRVLGTAIATYVVWRFVTGLLAVQTYPGSVSAWLNGTVILALVGLSLAGVTIAAAEILAIKNKSPTTTGNAR